MSERRERIDRAIDELVVACLETADTPDDEPGAVERILAEQRLRAAIAAMQTAEPTCPECGGHGRGCSFCGGTGDWPRTSEPTEAEIDAAALAYESAFNHPKGHWKIYQHDDPRATYKPGGFKFETMRAALLAARKARP